MRNISSIIYAPPRTSNPISLIHFQVGTLSKTFCSTKSSWSYVQKHWVYSLQDSISSIQIPQQYFKIIVFISLANHLPVRIQINKKIIPVKNFLNFIKYHFHSFFQHLNSIVILSQHLQSSFSSLFCAQPDLESFLHYILTELSLYQFLCIHEAPYTSSSASFILPVRPFTM